MKFDFYYKTNMKIIHQNMILRTITKDDIEQIRLWRNSEAVNQYLVTRKTVEQHEQNEWFDSLDPSTSMYFMMEESSMPFGVIYVHDVNQEEGSYWGSIFTGDTNYLNTHLPVKAVIMVVEFFFKHLHFERMYSKVHYKNLAALEMDQRMGFKEISREGEFISSQCSKDDFNRHAKALIKALLKDIPLRLVFDKDDDKHVFLNDMIDRQL